MRPLAVTLVSLLAHLDKARQLVVHVIDRQIPSADKELLARSLGDGAVTVCWHSPDRLRLVGVPLWGRMSISVYDKLLIADLALPEVDQALWLDSDTLVLADVAPVWDRGPGHHSLLAVQDSLVPLVSSRFGVARYRDLGLRPDAKYFNAGVMLMNLTQWRQRQVSGRALDYLKKYANDVSFWDQEGLNAVLSGEWGELDPAWNWSVNLRWANGDRVTNGAAKIIHFNGNLKPWTYDRRDAHYRAYYEYVDRTPWPGWRPSTSWMTAAVRSVRADIASTGVVPDRAGGHECLARADEESGHDRRREDPMMDSAAGSGSRLTIVLATDAYETLRPVIAALRKQTERAHLEILIVAPGETLGAVDWSEVDVFGSARVVNVAAPLSLPASRAAGVRAASAPLVFIGETHSFPHPRMAEVLLASFTDERCVAVVPAITNGNPGTALSWASYLTDYGTWGPGRPGGVLEQPPVYNAAFRRDPLLRLGDRLGELLDSNNEELWPILHRAGYHARFEPAAETHHVNAAELAAMLRIRFFAGSLIGTQRARRWTWGRRLAYVVASPLIPAVLVWRARSIVPFGTSGRKVPAGTLLGIALGAVAKTVGELLGYLGITLPAAESRLTENELHKLRHAGTRAMASTV